MNPVYARVAQSTIQLDKELRRYEKSLFLPLGVDGSIVDHILYSTIRRSRNDADYLENVVYASSKKNEIDVKKLGRIVDCAALEGLDIIGIDLRTKTGLLGDIIAEKIYTHNEQNEKWVAYSHAVLFDEHENADIRGCKEPLTDEERASIRWFPSQEDAEQLIRKVGDEWKYSITHEKIAAIEHVEGIKNTIEEILKGHPILSR